MIARRTLSLLAVSVLAAPGLLLGQEPPCDKAQPAVCRDLGVKYETGKGVPKKDEARAAALYQLACDGEDALGCLRLGMLYESGSGVTEDDAHATQLYDQACKERLAQGCGFAGDMYAKGVGVDKDEGKAAGLYLQACDGDFAAGCHNLAGLYEDGRGVEKDGARAVALYERGCQGGLGASCSSAGEMYTNASGVALDTKKAAALYAKGCEKKDSVSCERVVEAKSVVEGIAEARKAKADCAMVVKLLRPALLSTQPFVNDASLEAYDALDRCAWQEKFYETAAIVSAKKLVAGAAFVKHPADFPRALLRLGNFKDADEARADLQQTYPKDPDLKTVEARIAFQREDYQGAFDLSSEALALALAQAPPSNPNDPEVRARFVRARSLFFLTRLGDAKAELVALQPLTKRVPADQARAIRMLKDVAFAEKWGVAALWHYQEHVSLGIYHLLKNEADTAGGSLITLTLINFSPGDRELKVEVRIPGLTDRSTQSAILQKGEIKRFDLTPPLKLNFDAGRVTERRPVQLELKLSEPSASGSLLILERSLKVELLPHNYLPLSRKVGEDSERRTYENIAAWITPNTPAVEKLIAAAKARAPGANFPGEQAATGPQVKALWDELQSRGVSYVMDPDILAGEGIYQRIRLPDDVLATGSAQCLEGSILFATLFEAIGLRPLIVMVPGHSFVGWHASASDGVEEGTVVFLETTMVHDKPVDEAVAAAMKTYKEQVTPSNLKSGAAFVLDLVAMRRQGFIAQPSDW
jgi:hypothetical protein